MSVHANRLQGLAEGRTQSDVVHALSEIVADLESRLDALEHPEHTNPNNRENDPERHEVEREADEKHHDHGKTELKKVSPKTEDREVAEVKGASSQKKHTAR
jgi:hypothetical protein